MDSIIIKMTRDGFMKLLRSYPQAGARLFASFMNALSQRLRQSNEELLVLYEVGKIIGAAPPLAELLRSILCHTMAGTVAQFGVFFYVNDVTDMLEVKEAVGPGFEDILDLKMKVTDGLVGIALKKNEIIRINDLDSQPEYSQACRFGYERQRMMIAPLTRKSHPFGAILIAEPCCPCPFTSANQNLLAAVASQAAAAVEASLLKSDSETKEKFDRHFYRF
jgi:GAF domain-containing protein